MLGPSGRDTRGRKILLVPHCHIFLSCLEWRWPLCDRENRLLLIRWKAGRSPFLTLSVLKVISPAPTPPLDRCRFTPFCVGFSVT